MMGLVKKIIPIALILATFAIALNLINALRGEAEFHLDAIEYFQPKVIDQEIELSKINKNEDGDMKIMGKIGFRVVLNKDQFNNFWSEQTDLDLANNVVIFEVNSELNNFVGEIKIDKNKDYYAGDHYFEYKEEFTSVIDFSLSDVYLKLPSDAFLENGEVNPEFEYFMYFTFKSVLYNSDDKNPEPIYTRNHARIKFKLLEVNNRYILRHDETSEVINERIPLTTNWLDKIKNKFNDFWGE